MTTDLWSRLVADDSTPGYQGGTRRAIPPSETLRRIRPLLEPAGITRLADITGLDWIGVPVYQAIRPNSRTLSASQGKGTTRTEAKVSALMEALEGFHAEHVSLPSIRETIGSMRRHLTYDPATLDTIDRRLLTDDLILDWIPATDLTTGGPTWAPRDLCNLDLTVQPRLYAPVFRVSSNGLCSGNTVGEALIHGLCEVVERDSCARRVRAVFEPDRSVMTDTISTPTGQRLLARFFRAGVQLQIVDMTGPTGLPCYEVWVDDPDGPTLTDGSGCHPDQSIALVRALTEAAQSRLTYIAGARDDILRSVYRSPLREPTRRAFTPTSASALRPFAATRSVSVGAFAAQVREVVRRVRTQTGMSPIAVDLARPNVGLPVLFVIVPGLTHRLVGRAP